jgi:hypothetical protein
VEKRAEAAEADADLIERRAPRNSLGTVVMADAALRARAAGMCIASVLDGDGVGRLTRSSRLGEEEEEEEKKLDRSG